MKRFVAVVAILVAMVVFTTQESQAQFYRGGSGFNIGFSTGGFNNFNRGGFGGYGGGFNSFNRGGFNGGGFNSFGGGYSSFRPSYSRSYYRPSYGRSSFRGGYGGRSCGY